MPTLHFIVYLLPPISAFPDTSRKSSKSSTTADSLVPLANTINSSPPNLPTTAFGNFLESSFPIVERLEIVYIKHSEKALCIRLFADEPLNVVCCCQLVQQSRCAVKLDQLYHSLLLTLFIVYILCSSENFYYLSTGIRYA